MDQKRENKILIKITGVDSFRLRVREDEESSYRYIVDKINENVHRFQSGVNGDSPSVALAKVAIYYATLLFEKSKHIASQQALLEDFEKNLDSLLEGTD